MMLPAELRLGPFKVDRGGMLSPATPQTFPRFIVRWRDRLVHTRMSQASDDGACGVLDVTMRLGRVPSSAGLSSAQRIDALETLQHLPHSLPQGWQLRLLPDHAVQIEASVTITLPVSAVGLVTELSCFLIRLSPYLDLLEETGFSAATFAPRATTTH